MVNLEKGIIVSLVALVGGLFLLGLTINEWRLVNFGNLNTQYTLRLLIPGIMLASLGFESILFSFFASVLRMQRK